jgi:methyltransferase-like protein/2-polyprenyl-3-methyl-5-hydroxy-6-metoxy-1,4-benzoquinol methylase
MSQPKTNEVASSYDSLPYISYPFDYTRPENLRSIAMIFGLTPPKVENARVLEIGCAAGMGLIPFAINYPKSTCVGIDISNVEIEHGKETLRDLGMKNVELKNLSITDITEKDGKFDYIICHGVYSWVHDEIKDQILSVCKNNLSKDGVAFVSYNTFPGWNMSNTIRDMMQYHASTVQDSRDKIVQAQAFLGFVRESVANTNTPFAQFLAQEANFISSQQPSYIYHEYIEGDNHPTYFYQFANLLKAKKLKYVCDTHIASMFSGNLAPKAAETISQIPDIIRSEQYIDFINNRRFRSSILCHEDQKINYNINPDILDHFYLIMNVKPYEGKIAEKITDSSPDKFYLNDNKELTLTTVDQDVKAILHTFAEIGKYPITIDELIKLAGKKFNFPDYKAIKAKVKLEMVRVLFNGYLKITASKPKYINKISERPKASALARYQATKSSGNKLWVANQISEVVNINPLEKHLIMHMDGTNNKQDLLNKLIQDYKEQKFNILIDGKPIDNDEEFKKHLIVAIDECLEKQRNCAILVA